MAFDSKSAQSQPPMVADRYLLVLPWDLRDDSGGVNEVVRSLYDGIARDGRLAPLALVLAWDAVHPVEARDSAGRQIVQLRLMSFDERGSPLLGLLRYLGRLPAELWRLRRFVKERRVAIVNCHYIGASEPLWMIAKALGIFRGRVFLSLHGKDIRTLAELRGVRKAFWRWVLRRADAIVACSVGLATETIEKFDLDPATVVTIHNGFDIARLGSYLPASATERAASSQAPELLNLGTFEHKKGHDILLRAFRGVVDAMPHARLTIMGRRSETTESTLQLVEELGLGPHVTVRVDAPHDAALEALKRSDLFVLPSRNEAFSVALLEAAAFGKPIVATDVCGVAELIENGVTGVVVPSENVALLTRGILGMLADPGTAAEYGRRLRERIVTQFTAERTSVNYLRLAGLQRSAEN